MKRARVLLVEDDASIRRYVGMALRDLPLDLVEAGTLHAARQALASGSYALLLLDLMLPDGNGLALLAELQAEPTLRGPARTVVFSAGVSGAVRERVMALGAWQVLDKPVALAALVGCVEQALAGPDPPTPTPSPSPSPSPSTESALQRGEGSPAMARTAAIAAHFAGHAGLYDSFRAASVAQFDADIAEADAACLRPDLAALRRQAHNLKTVLLLLGAEDASAQARALESAAAGATTMTALLPLWQTLRSVVRSLR